MTSLQAAVTQRVQQVLYHLRHAFRRLWREPAFTTAAVLTLALGIGANIAVFAVVDAVLRQPLGYPDADRLLVLQHRDVATGITKEYVAIGDYVDITTRQRTFEAVGAYGMDQGTITPDVGEPFRVVGLVADGVLLDALGMRPVIGRSLTRDDSRPDAGPVALLGYDLWVTHFGRDRTVVGRSFRFDDKRVTVVGVAPPNFRFPPTATTDVIVPMTLPAQAPAERKSSWTFGLGRLARGRSIAAATRDLADVSRTLERDYPASNRGSSYFAIPLRDALVGSTKPALLLLLAAVGVVLLIACANVANLLLARSLSRRREMALRLALGAGRGRLAMQLLSESLALATVASIAGIVVARWGARAVVAALPNAASVPGLTNVRLDGTVLAFAVGLTMVTTVVFGVVTLFTIGGGRTTVATALAGGGRLSMSPGARRATSSLVGVEVALALVLLTGAGLVVRTIAGLLAVNPGFRPDHVMTIDIQLPMSRYQGVEARDGFYRRAFAALGAVPGVEAAGAAVVTPLTGNNWTTSFERPEQPTPHGERPPEVGWQLASSGYFKALRIRLVAGRLFDSRDVPNGHQVAIVSEAVQRRFFPNESAVGHLIKGDGGPREIVGVVGDIRRAGLRDEPRPDLYLPFEQSPSPAITLFIRTQGDPERALPTLREALKSTDAGAIVTHTQTLSDIASESMRTTQLVLSLLAVFALTALVLAAVGIYGVMSYVVRQRTREIGTRIALGATRRDIVWLVMRQGVSIAGIGTIVGLVIGLVATRSLASVVYGVSTSDPLTLTTAATVLMATTMLACYLPARRAAALDPARTLTDW